MHVNMLTGLHDPMDKGLAVGGIDLATVEA